MRINIGEPKQPEQSKVTSVRIVRKKYPDRMSECLAKNMTEEEAAKLIEREASIQDLFSQKSFVDFSRGKILELLDYISEYVGYVDKYAIGAGYFTEEVLRVIGIVGSIYQTEEAVNSGDVEAFRKHDESVYAQLQMHSDYDVIQKLLVDTPSTFVPALARYRYFIQYGTRDRYLDYEQFMENYDNYIQYLKSGEKREKFSSLLDSVSSSAAEDTVEVLGMLATQSFPAVLQQLGVVDKDANIARVAFGTSGGYMPECIDSMDERVLSERVDMIACWLAIYENPGLARCDSTLEVQGNECSLFKYLEGTNAESISIDEEITRLAVAKRPKVYAAMKRYLVRSGKEELAEKLPLFHEGEYSLDGNEIRRHLANQKLFAFSQEFGGGSQIEIEQIIKLIEYYVDRVDGGRAYVAGMYLQTLQKIIIHSSRVSVSREHLFGLIRRTLLKLGPSEAFWTGISFLMTYKQRTGSKEAQHCIDDCLKRINADSVEDYAKGFLGTFSPILTGRHSVAKKADRIGHYRMAEHPRILLHDFSDGKEKIPVCGLNTIFKAITDPCNTGYYKACLIVGHLIEEEGANGKVTERFIGAITGMLNQASRHNGDAIGQERQDLAIQAARDVFSPLKESLHYRLKYRMTTVLTEYVAKGLVAPIRMTAFLGQVVPFLTVEEKKATTSRKSVESAAEVEYPTRDLEAVKEAIRKKRTTHISHDGNIVPVKAGETVLPGACARIVIKRNKVTKRNPAGLACNVSFCFESGTMYGRLTENGDLELRVLDGEGREKEIISASTEPHFLEMNYLALIKLHQVCVRKPFCAHDQEWEVTELPEDEPDSEEPEAPPSEPELVAEQAQTPDRFEGAMVVDLTEKQKRSLAAFKKAERIRIQSNRGRVLAAFMPLKRGVELPEESVENLSELVLYQKECIEVGSNESEIFDVIADPEALYHRVRRGEVDLGDIFVRKARAHARCLPFKETKVEREDEHGVMRRYSRVKRSSVSGLAKFKRDWAVTTGDHEVIQIAEEPKVVSFQVYHDEHTEALHDHVRSPEYVRHCIEALRLEIVQKVENFSQRIRAKYGSNGDAVKRIVRKLSTLYGYSDEEFEEKLKTGENLPDLLRHWIAEFRQEITEALGDLDCDVEGIIRKIDHFDCERELDLRDMQSKSIEVMEHHENEGRKTDVIKYQLPIAGMKTSVTYNQGQFESVAELLKKGK